MPSKGKYALEIGNLLASANSNHIPNRKNIVNFVSNILEELPTIYLSPKSFLTFHTNCHMFTAPGFLLAVVAFPHLLPACSLC